MRRPAKDKYVFVLEPSSHAELVSRYTSQPMATCCSHVPISDRPCPVKKSR